jgi:4-hydroxy-tetrahydrodipicolinate synthase
MFKGSGVALVTPMFENGEIDEKTMENLVEWHIKAGTAAIIVAGTTGESATLSTAELHRVISLVVSIAQKRIVVIAGTGTNATGTTIAKSQAAQKIGAQGCLIVTPYYNRPTQEGLIQHYTNIAKAVDLPIILYNVPTRTGCDMLPSTVSALSSIPNIIGIKEATGNLQRLEQLQNSCHPDFLYYSGDDPSARAFMTQGGHGVISITSNVVPQLMQKMCHYALSDKMEQAIKLDSTLQPLHHALISEPNPIPVKWALHYQEKIKSGIRLPLTVLSTTYHELMKQALQTAGE